MSLAQDRSGAGRLFGHEDVDLFTILPAGRIDGLQVWNHRSGKWVRMSAPYGSIIINTGDYMQRITNDALPSTTHRVGKPSDRSHLTVPRVSFPMAVYVWEDEVLEVFRVWASRDIRSQGDHLPYAQHEQVLWRRLRRRRGLARARPHRRGRQSPTTVVHSRTCQRATRPSSNVGIVEGKSFGDALVVTVEHKHGTVDRIGERAGDNQLAAIMGGPGMLEVRFAKFRTSPQIIGVSFIEEKEVFQSDSYPACCVRLRLLLLLVLRRLGRCRDSLQAAGPWFRWPGRIYSSCRRRFCR